MPRTSAPEAPAAANQVKQLNNFLREGADEDAKVNILKDE